MKILNLYRFQNVQLFFTQKQQKTYKTLKYKQLKFKYGYKT